MLDFALALHGVAHVVYRWTLNEAAFSDIRNLLVKEDKVCHIQAHPRSHPDSDPRASLLRPDTVRGSG